MFSVIKALNKYLWYIFNNDLNYLKSQYPTFSFRYAILPVKVQLLNENEFCPTHNNIKWYYYW